MSITKNLLIVLFVFSAMCFSQNHYDLIVGTTRYYDAGQNYGWIFLGRYIGIEEIIGDTLIEGRTYAVVKWEAQKILDMEDEVTFYNDTSCYRFDKGFLYTYTLNGDSVVQNFTFSTGDTIRNFYSDNELDLFLSQPPVVTIYDAVVTFTDGTEHNIIWGDDTTSIYTYPTTSIPDKQTFMDSVLIDRGETWLLPFGSTQTYFPYKPFYFIDSLGILYSEWNYRKMALVGIKNPDGRLYGQKVRFITGVENFLSKIDSYKLYQNYPNPFNSQTRIDFDLQLSGKVTITIFNIAGQKVVTLLDGVKTAGQHSLTFNAEGLSSGVYY